MKASDFHIEKENENYFPLIPTINYLSRLSKEKFRSTLAESGLFVGQEEILFAIMFNEGQKSSDIAKKLNCSLASLSVSLKRLEKSGFIMKIQDECDARTSKIYLTETGKSTLKSVHKKLHQYEERMFQGFSDDEMINLRCYLDRIIENTCGMSDFTYRHPRHIKEEQDEEQRKNKKD